MTLTQKLAAIAMYGCFGSILFFFLMLIELKLFGSNFDKGRAPVCLWLCGLCAGATVLGFGLMLLDGLLHAIY